MNTYKTTIAIMLTCLSLTVQAGSEFQTNALFKPNKGLLLAEAGGRVMIYDGLKSETVEKAMDEQFDRIENMMFVRTQVAQEDGSYEAENDCD